MNRKICGMYAQFQRLRDQSRFACYRLQVSGLAMVSPREAGLNLPTPKPVNHSRSESLSPSGQKIPMQARGLGTDFTFAAQIPSIDIVFSL